MVVPASQISLLSYSRSSLSRILLTSITTACGSPFPISSLLPARFPSVLPCATFRAGLIELFIIFRSGISPYCLRLPRRHSPIVLFSLAPEPTMAYYHIAPSYSSTFGQATKMGELYVAVSALSSLHPQCLRAISRMQILEDSDLLHQM